MLCGSAQPHPRRPLPPRLLILRRCVLLRARASRHCSTLQRDGIATASNGWSTWAAEPRTRMSSDAPAERDVLDEGVRDAEVRGLRRAEPCPTFGSHTGRDPIGRSREQARSPSGRASTSTSPSCASITKTRVTQQDESTSSKPGKSRTSRLVRTSSPVGEANPLSGSSASELLARPRRSGLASGETGSPPRQRPAELEDALAGTALAADLGALIRRTIFSIKRSPQHRTEPGPDE